MSIPHTVSGEGSIAEYIDPEHIYPDIVAESTQEILTCIACLPSDGIFDHKALLVAIRSVVVDIYQEAYSSGMDKGKQAEAQKPNESEATT